MNVSDLPCVLPVTNRRVLLDTEPSRIGDCLPASGPAVPVTRAPDCCNTSQAVSFSTRPLAKWISKLPDQVPEKSSASAASPSIDSAANRHQPEMLFMKPSFDRVVRES